MKTLFFIILIFFSIQCFSQQDSTLLIKLEKQLIELIQTENSFFQENSQIPSNASKLKIQNKFTELLKSPGADKYSFNVLSSTLQYEFRLFNLDSNKLRVFQLFRFFDNYPDGSYNVISLIQHKTKRGEIQIFPLSNYRKLYSSKIFHKDIAFEILEIDKIKNRGGNLYLVQAHQGFVLENQSINRIVYFFIYHNDNYVILDKPIYNNEQFLVFTTTESNYLGDIQTTFENSIPIIRAWFPINKHTKANKTTNLKDDTFVEVVLRFNGTSFKRIKHTTN